MTDSKSTVYRGHRITYHEDAGHIVIHDAVVVFAAPTLAEAKDWVDQFVTRAKSLKHLMVDKERESDGPGPGVA